MEMDPEKLEVLRVWQPPRWEVVLSRKELYKRGKELLAMKVAFETWWHHLEGIRHQIEALLKELKIQVCLSSVHHLETDGGTEWMDDILELYLQCFMNQQQDNWADMLAVAKFAYNSLHTCIQAKDLPTFKDNDFLNEGQKLHVGVEYKKKILEKLKQDVEFLAQLKIMDYSLLVGIHDVDRAEQEEMEVEDRAEDEECENDGIGGNPICSYGTPPESPGNLLNFPRFFGPGEFDTSVDVYAMKSHEGAPKKEVYFMAIIDILTPYDTKKKAAHAAKTVKHGAGAEISTVNPEQYSKRFNEFMSNILT
ncbi:phosphatidylinositol 5-phosphate 4-kinase type-2 beta [Protobothrops mucrosquamatus]|uniref:phosphatidylinositol 5-phosphate 4-kinase type-2 beta n=1 Tax=Protobothrops mucrosquamatus TaxID=103944 RepID=UPI00077597C8|nr:phosphatidylinositol 5-phosphate 4-kinase type-2 beta [Protobothrops mucrosquamatus]